MNRRSGSRAPPSRVGAWLLASVIVLLPLARGGVALWAEALAAGISLLAAALVLRERREITLATFALGVVALLIALQLVPLPPALHALSPGARRTFEVALAPHGAYPAVRPLSLDVPGTARGLAMAVACLAAFVAGSALAGTGRRRSIVIRSLGVSAGAVAATVLGSALVGAEPLLAGRFPFVNPNHLGAFLNLTAFVALGLGLRASGNARLAWLATFAVAGATVFLSLSRGGIAAFLGGIVVFVGLHAGAARRWSGSPLSPALSPGGGEGETGKLPGFGGGDGETGKLSGLGDGERETGKLPGHGGGEGKAGKRHRSHFALTGAVAAGLGIAAYLALGPVLAELETLRGASGEVKVRLWADALRMVADFPIVGVGKGAFPVAFPPYASEPSPFTAHFVENGWLQPLLDLGVPAGLLLVATFAWIWVSAARAPGRSATDTGLLAGAAALGLHLVGDFAIELAAVALPFAVVMGLLTRGARTVAVSWKVTAPMVAALAAASTAGLVLYERRGLPAQDLALVAAARSGDPLPVVAGAMAWRAADHLPHVTAGKWLAEGGQCREAMPWLVSAMALAPLEPEAHLLAARCLGRGGQHAQARREYRLAYACGLHEVLSEAAARYPDPADLAGVVPETPDAMLDAGRLLLAARPDLAAGFLERAAREYADDRALLPLARARLAMGDLAGALTLAQRELTLRVGSVEGYRLAAGILDRQGRSTDAQEILERGVTAVPGAPALLTALAERALAARRPSEARRFADEIVPRTAADVALKHHLAARALEAQGRVVEAIGKAESAAAALPESTEPLIFLAALLERVRRYDEAIASVERAGALPHVRADAFAPILQRLRAARDAAAQERLRRSALGLPDDLRPSP